MNVTLTKNLVSIAALLIEPRHIPEYQMPGPGRSKNVPLKISFISRTGMILIHKSTNIKHHLSLAPSPFPSSRFPPPLSNSFLALSNRSALPLNNRPIPSSLPPSKSILLPSPSFKTSFAASRLPALLYISVFTLSSPSLASFPSPDDATVLECSIFLLFLPPNIFFQNEGGLMIRGGEGGTQADTSCRHTSIREGDLGRGGAILR